MIRDLPLPALVLALLALTGFYQMPEKGPAPDDAEKTAHAEGGASNGGNGGKDHQAILTPLYDFWDAGDGKNPTPPDLLNDERHDLTFLIAMVPDPVGSSVGYRFDDTRNAIQQAIESQGHTLDRFRLPWEENRRPRSPSTAFAGQLWPDGGQLSLRLTPPAEKPAGRPSARPYDGQPGLLLFRRQVPKSLPEKEMSKLEGKQPLLLLFLVGESPTWGIDKQALATTLDLLMLHKATQHHPVFRIIGPCFSGSQKSLEVALSKWTWRPRPGGIPQFKMISGSATGIDLKGLRAAVPAEVTFAATVHRASDVELVLFDFLTKLEGSDKHKPLRVVLLHENTSYGQNRTINPYPEDKYPIHHKVRISQLAFPLHISELRRAFAKEEKAREGQLRASGAAGSLLVVPLEENSGVRDAIPPQTPEMSAPAAEQLLGRILTSISQEQPHYVGIVATDVRDKLFLAELIHERCPDVRLFTIGSDMLFAHPQQGLSMRGMLVASSYPLSARNQPLSYPFRSDRRTVFATQAAQGTYNAALIQLSKEIRDRENWYHRFLIEYGPVLSQPSQSESLAPGIWISVVGGRDFFPVHVSAPPAGSKYVFSIPVSRLPKVQDPQLAKHWEDYFVKTRESAIRQAIAYPGVWSSTFVLISLACAGVVISSWFGLAETRARRNGGRKQQGSDDEEDEQRAEFMLLFKNPAAADHRRHHIILALSFMLAAVVYGCLIWPTIYPVAVTWAEGATAHGWFGRLSHYGIPAVGFTIFAALILSVSLPLTLLWESSKVQPQSRRWLIGIWLFVVAIVFGVLVTILPPGLAVLVTAILAGLLWVLPEAGTGTGGLVCRLGGASLVLGLMLMFLMAFLVSSLPENDLYPKLWAFDRATRLTSGISPQVPVLFLGLAFGCWAYQQLKCIHLMNRFMLTNPFPPGAGNAAGVNRHATALDRIAKHQGNSVRALRKPLGDPTTLLFVAAFFASCWLRLADRVIPSWETLGFDLLFYFSLALMTFLLVALFLQFLLVWRHVSRLLGAIALLPLAKAFERLPLPVTSSFGRYLDAYRNRFAQHSLAHQQIAYMETLYDEDMQKGLTVRLGTPPPPRPVLKAKSTWDDQVRYMHWCLLVLEPVWRDRPVVERVAAEGKDDKSKPTTQESKLAAWDQAAEDIVAIQAVRFLSQFFVQLRNMAYFLVIIPLLLLLAVTAFPFQPQGLLRLFLGTIIAFIAGGIVLFFVQMDRDEVVSLISKTTPNRVHFDRTFWVRMATYVLPLVAVLFAQLANVSDLFRPWLEPILRVVK